MFLQASVILSTEGGGVVVWSRGVSIFSWGGPPIFWGLHFFGGLQFSGGVSNFGGVSIYSGGVSPIFQGGLQIFGGSPNFRQLPRLMNGRYASYWNAFLFHWILLNSEKCWGEGRSN